jgi:hypothetical protein
MDIPTRFDRAISVERAADQWVKDTSIDSAVREFRNNEVYRKNHCAKFVVVQHFYTDDGPSYPMPMFGSRLEDLALMLTNSKAGDILCLWILTSHPRYYEFLCPDKNGMFPIRMYKRVPR